MIQIDLPHPLTDYDRRHACIALAAAIAAFLLSHFLPSPLTHDLCALVSAYAGAVLVLWSASRVQRPRIVALLAVLALLAGTASAQIAWHSQSDSATFLIRDARHFVCLMVVGLTIFPTFIPRWLAWRDQQTLARQAAAHAEVRALLEARLAALQGQIEPHFLFNTLANVLYLLRRDAEAAERMLDHLLTYFRATLKELRQIEAPLGQELARVRAYLDIMGLRMGERLSYRIDCPEELESMPLPPLSLATLVENAIKHGLEPKVGAGRVAISAGRRDNRFWIAVEDDGVGFSETGGEGGLGLKNLRERLALFSKEANLTLEPVESGGVRAIIEMPA